MVDGKGGSGCLACWGEIPRTQICKTSSPLSWKEDQKGTDSTYCSPCQERVHHHQWWVRAYRHARLQALYSEPQCGICWCPDRSSYPTHWEGLENLEGECLEAQRKPHRRISGGPPCSYLFIYYYYYYYYSFNNLFFGQGTWDFIQNL